jgi:hypothetical protein
MIPIYFLEPGVLHISKGPLNNASRINLLKAWKAMYIWRQTRTSQTISVKWVTDISNKCSALWWSICFLYPLYTECLEHCFHVQLLSSGWLAMAPSCVTTLYLKVSFSLRLLIHGCGQDFKERMVSTTFQVNILWRGQVESTLGMTTVPSKLFGSWNINLQ